jgi:xanthine/uracil permease
MESVETMKKPVLKVGIEEKVEPAKALVFGLQHVLAMFAVLTFEFQSCLVS